MPLEAPSPDGRARVEWCDDAAIPWLTLVFAFLGQVFGVSAIFWLILLSLVRPRRSVPVALIATAGIALGSVAAYGVGTAGRSALYVDRLQFLSRARLAEVTRALDDHGVLSIIRFSREPRTESFELAVAAGESRFPPLPAVAALTIPDALLIFIVAALCGIVGHLWRLGRDRTRFGNGPVAILGKISAVVLFLGLVALLPFLFGHVCQMARP